MNEMALAMTAAALDMRIDVYSVRVGRNGELSMTCPTFTISS